MADIDRLRRASTRTAAHDKNVERIRAWGHAGDIEALIFAYGGLIAEEEHLLILAAQKDSRALGGHIAGNFAANVIGLRTVHADVDIGEILSGLDRQLRGGIERGCFGIAGANGADIGLTWLRRRLVHHSEIHFLDADVILAGR